MTIEGSKCDDPPEPATERPSRAVVGHDLFVTHQLTGVVAAAILVLAMPARNWHWSPQA